MYLVYYVKLMHLIIGDSEHDRKCEVTAHGSTIVFTRSPLRQIDLFQGCNKDEDLTGAIF